MLTYFWIRRRSKLRSRRSSDLMLIYACIAGVSLVALVVCFLVLVMLDASIAGRVIDLLLHFAPSPPLGGQVAFAGVAYGNYW